MTCAVCPHPDDCAGRCLTPLIREQLKRSHSPRVMTPSQARTVMTMLRDGVTLRRLHAGNVVTVNKLKYHCARYPIFGAEVMRLAEVNRIAADRLKGSATKRAQTHCIRGHELSGDNLGWKRNGTNRYCRACNRLRLKTSGSISTAQIERIKLLLSQGVALGDIQGSRKRSRNFYTAPENVVTRHRKNDAEFNAFVLDKLQGANSRGQRRRYDRVRNVRRREEANDYQRISSMVPGYLPHRDDVIQSIFRALLDGSLRREDVGARVKTFITMENKFTNNPWRDLSLDAPVAPGSTMTFVETIVENRWD